jgi:hypothetical protein
MMNACPRWLLMALAGCASTSPPAAPAAKDGGAAGWQAALEGLAASATTTVYSFRFDGAPPTGAFYRLAAHDSDVAAACSRYGADAGAAGSDDFWVLEVDVNDSNPGTHAISLVLRNGAPLATANVTLLHRRGGAYVEAYDAVSGMVSLTSTPTPTNAKQGAALDGLIEADFPEHALSGVECQSLISRDGGAPTTTCTCRGSDGGVSTCSPQVDGQNCCHDLASARKHVSLAFSAAHCPNMCRWAAGLSTDYCYQYFGP